jgi:acyl-CoA thioesterase I
MPDADRRYRMFFLACDWPGSGGLVVQQRTRVVFLGDSVTAGFGLAGAPSYVDLLATRLQSCGSPCDLLPSALDGIDTVYAIRRFARMVTALEPDWVVVLLGLNDAFPCSGRAAVSPREFEDNLLALVDRILTLEARPVLVSPNPRFDWQPGDTAQDVDLMPPYVAAIARAAHAADVPWIDLHGPFQRAGGRTLVPDGTHPCAEGHRLIADVLENELACLWTTSAEGATASRVARRSPAGAAASGRLTER